MSQMLIIEARNNLLGRCMEVPSFKDGINSLKEMFLKRFNRDMSAAEESELKKTRQVIVNFDSNSFYAYGITDLND